VSDDHDHAPHYYGGQAVIEGVMMRGQTTWAVAVRRPSGEIYLERHLVSDFAKRRPIFTKPMFRGMYGLVDALTIGTRALTISANQSVEEEEQLSGKAMGGSLLMALLLFVGVFIVLPNVGLAALRPVFGSELVYHIVESVVRVVIFLGYLGAISLLADIRRVFAYHGGEHKTIAAWEHGEPLQPSDVQPYSTLHVRCGTNFLLLVMVIATFVYTLAGTLVPPSDDIGTLAYAAYQILLRVILLPVVAGLAYEGLRLGAGKEDSNILVRAMMKPGLWLQKITTKPPSDEMVEVAIRAFEAVVPAGELVGRTTDLPSPVVWGPDDTEPGRFGRPKEQAGAAHTTGEDHDGPQVEPFT
jgi:uncharacterized protein YqhQ